MGVRLDFVEILPSISAVWFTACLKCGRFARDNDGYCVRLTVIGLLHCSLLYGFMLLPFVTEEVFLPIKILNSKLTSAFICVLLKDARNDPEHVRGQTVSRNV